MTLTALVTGGAGFIGSHLVDALVDKGYRVRVLDSLDEQVHGMAGRPPNYLNREAELVVGDIRSREVVIQALEGVDVVFHEAAAVGVGQSMYEIQRYVDVNSRGCAVLLDVLVNERNSVQKLIVASSMSIYGEGKYFCPQCERERYPQVREKERLERGEWELYCPDCNSTLTPLPTDESKPPSPTSVYAITKRDHEDLCLTVGRAYSIPVVALRYFNVYGPRQSLSNPYTGVIAIFLSRIMNGNPPLVFEDGLQSRDFVHVTDIVQANILALERDEANYQVYNVGTGRRVTLLDLLRTLETVIRTEVRPQYLGKFREGDIRHCYADIDKIQKELGFHPQVSLEEGIKDLVNWVTSQKPVDRVTRALQELLRRGLAR